MVNVSGLQWNVARHLLQCQEYHKLRGVQSSVRLFIFVYFFYSFVEVGILVSTQHKDIS